MVHAGDVTVAGLEQIRSHLCKHSPHKHASTCVRRRGGIHARKPGADLLTQHDLAGVEIAPFPFFFFLFFPPTKTYKVNIP